MRTHHTRFPFSPFPNGWYFVCYAHELPPGRLFSKTFMGREIIAFRGPEGRAAVADAHCPHLGAHLGRGGAVVDGTVRCPFHDFRFDCSGTCVSTPYGPPPKAARLGMWPSLETGGFILAYFDAKGRAPTWQPPAIDNAGFGALRTKYFRVRSHPQETTENSVDPGHLGVVHHYEDVTPVEPLRIEGPYLTGAYGMRRSAGPLAFLNLALESQFRVHVWGPGFSHVEVTVPHYGIAARQWIFSTPSDGEYVDLHIAMRVQPIAHAARIIPGLDKLPERLVTWGLHALVMKTFENDIAQDFDIWEHKAHIARPALARGDGPIGLYRRYCKQFYELGEGPAAQRDDEQPAHVE